MSSIRTYKRKKAGAIRSAGGASQNSSQQMYEEEEDENGFNPPHNNNPQNMEESQEKRFLLGFTAEGFVDELEKETRPKHPVAVKKQVSYAEAKDDAGDDGNGDNPNVPKPGANSSSTRSAHSMSDFGEIRMLIDELDYCLEGLESAKGSEKIIESSLRNLLNIFLKPQVLVSLRARAGLVPRILDALSSSAASLAGEECLSSLIALAIANMILKEPLNTEHATTKHISWLVSFFRPLSKTEVDALVFRTKKQALSPSRSNSSSTAGGSPSKLNRSSSNNHNNNISSSSNSSSIAAAMKPRVLKAISAAAIPQVQEHLREMEGVLLTHTTKSYDIDCWWMALRSVALLSKQSNSQAILRHWVLEGHLSSEIGGKMESLFKGLLSCSFQIAIAHDDVISVHVWTLLREYQSCPAYLGLLELLSGSVVSSKTRDVFLPMIRDLFSVVGLTGMPLPRLLFPILVSEHKFIEHANIAGSMLSNSFCVDVLQCALRCLINLTNNDDEASILAGKSEGSLLTVLSLVSRTSPLSADHYFDIHLLSLGLLINMTEKTRQNREMFADLAVVVDGGVFGAAAGAGVLSSSIFFSSSTTNSLKLLVDLYCSNVRKQEKEGGESARATEINVATAHIAILIGCLIRDCERNHSMTRSFLPPTVSYSSMVDKLNEFILFQQHAGITQNTESIRAIIDVFQSCKS